jgi:excisionase family DNA binding protein
VPEWDGEDMGDPQRLRDVFADDPLLLTPEEAATVLRIGRTTIDALIEAGELGPVHIGCSFHLPHDGLERSVHGLQAPPPARSIGASLRVRRQSSIRQGPGHR